MTKTGDSVKYLPIACDSSSGSDTTATVEYIRGKLRYLAYISAGKILCEIHGNFGGLWVFSTVCIIKK